MSQPFDVVIVGGGLVGGALALALAPGGLTVALIDGGSPGPVAAADSWDNRVYAISPGSAHLLQSCGVWDAIAPERVQQVEAMKIFGDQPGAMLEFSAYDAGLRELAHIVENRLLAQALREQLARAANVSVIAPARCTGLSWSPGSATIELDNERVIEAALVVAADGADSWVRARAGIESTGRDYGHVGVVANFAAEKTHAGTAFQWFAKDGILALLPLPGGRVSMVWSVPSERAETLLAISPGDLALQVAAASHHELGTLECITPAAGYPLRLARARQLVQPRLALIGDAAHNLHPLAGQGVNLGFRDVRELAAVLNGRGAETDCGRYSLLRRYERARSEDITAMQWMTDGLQKLFDAEAVWVARLRNGGLKMVNTQPMLKKMFVRHAIA